MKEQKIISRFGIPDDVRESYLKGETTKHNVFKPISASFVGGPTYEEFKIDQEYGIEPSQEDFDLRGVLQTIMGENEDAPSLDSVIKNFTHSMYVVVEVSPSDENLVKPVDFFFSKEKAIAFLKEQRTLYPDKTFEISNKYAVVRQIIEKFLEMPGNT